MPPNYVLAREHLQRAATMLQDSDSRTRQLRYIIERTISLMEEPRRDGGDASANVLDLAAFRGQQPGQD